MSTGEKAHRVGGPPQGRLGGNCPLSWSYSVHSTLDDVHRFRSSRRPASSSRSSGSAALGSDDADEASKYGSGGCHRLPAPDGLQGRRDVACGDGRGDLARCCLQSRARALVALGASPICLGGCSGDGSVFPTMHSGTCLEETRCCPIGSVMSTLSDSSGGYSCERKPRSEARCLAGPDRVVWRN